MKESDEYGTPVKLINMLLKEFPMDLDVCSRPELAKFDFFAPTIPASAGLYKCLGIHSLNLPWHEYSKTGFCWMNPPYSEPFIWARKAVEESKVMTVVSIIRADTSTEWWRRFVTQAMEIRFTRRIRFDGACGVYNFPTAIVIWNGQGPVKYTYSEYING